ncbi:glycoside hydrolase family 65 protein [Streptomyces sp. NPDC049813]|uniref:glycoside hydrolase family 65 protein n=1 Tax=Streptomyces sp. NPDC049813 TaxID=3365597 RepID=UPI0037B09A20
MTEGIPYAAELIPAQAAGPSREVPADPDWTWSFPGREDPDCEGWRETLCTLGNGLFATRGAHIDTAADDVHYPGTYAAGCFNRTRSVVDARPVVTESIVNLPNWLPLRCSVLTPEPHGPPRDLNHRAARVLAHHYALDLRHGLLRRTYRIEDEDGRRTRLEEIRLVHMADPHLAAIRLTVTAENWSGTLSVAAELDGTVSNSQVDRYRALGGQQLTGLDTGVDRGTAWLTCHTTDTLIAVALASRLHVDVPGSAGVRALRHGRCPGRITTTTTCPLSPGQSAVIDKTVALRTARLLATDHLRALTVSHAEGAAPFPLLLAAHQTAWERLWRRVPHDDPPADRLRLRLCRFHLLQVMSPHSRVRDTGVPARGLSGEEYHGRVFWDELPVITWLSRYFPNTAKSALDYRHRRLPAACRAAAAHGLPGALYPWQSGHDGDETTVPVVLNPLSERWSPDHTALQRHIGVALTHTVHTYAATTGDLDHLHGRGAEMILQVARYFAAAARHSPADDRYHLHRVMGPDEFHDQYPQAAEPGLTDNAYTNILVSHTLARAGRLWRRLPGPRRRELRAALGLTDDELGHWDTVAHRLAVPFHSGVISQFARYEELAPFPWDRYGDRGALRRLDQLLEREGDHPRNYQVTKQPDTLMLGYLFSPDEILTALARLGYATGDRLWVRTVDYYLERTTHGSTLSAPVHAHVLGAVGHPEAERFRRRALAVDAQPADTTARGLHLGAMAAALLLPPSHTT